MQTILEDAHQPLSVQGTTPNVQNIPLSSATVATVVIIVGGPADTKEGNRQLR